MATPSRFAARRGYSFHLDLSPKNNGVREDLTGWTAECEIRDSAGNRIVRLQTSPAPAGSPVDPGQGTITIEVLPVPLVTPPPTTSRFVLDIPVTTMSDILEGTYTIEFRAFDTFGRDWEFIPPTPFEVGKTVLRGGS